MIKKISNKDRKDWNDFINKDEKIYNKDQILKKNNRSIKKIDLHGYSLQDANEAIDKFIKKCFDDNVMQIIVITGKGLRSKNISNPYVSKDLGILKYSVPEYIESRNSLMHLIKEIKALISENSVKGIIIGNPINMDGSTGKSSQSASDFSKNLSKNITIPISLWDERLSTVGSFKITKKLVTSNSNRVKNLDKNAAAFILQGAIDFLKN